MTVTKNNLKEKSKELIKNKVYMLHCINYATKNKYYLQNGKVYKADVFNFEFAKTYHKTRLPDGLFEVKLIPAEKNKLFNINN